MFIVNISGEIGWDITPEDVKKQLAVAKGKDIDVHLASPGGFVFDGIEIFNALRDYKKDYPKCQMMLTIKGLAASMASYIAVNPAFDLVTAEDNAVLMIHNARGGAVGDYRDMNKASEIMEGITDLLGKAYANKTGKEQKEVRKLMDEESWYFGNEIMESGFVDEMVPSHEKTEKEEEASILIGFFKNSEKGNYVSFSKKQIALAVPARKGNPIANIFINDAANFNNPKYDLFKIIVHELGHCFNMGHSSDEACIMFPKYNGDKEMYLSFEAIDILNSMYGELKSKYNKDVI